MYNKLWIVVALALIFPSFGFVCANRVDSMEADLNALRVQLEEIQQRVNNEQTQLTEMIARADKKLDELSASQDLADEKASTSSIGLARQMEKDRRELANLRGELERQQKQNEALQQSLSSIMASMGSTKQGDGIVYPQDADGLYMMISNERIAKRTDREISASEEFIRRYPGDPRTEEVLSRLSEAYSNAGRSQEVIATAKQYLQNYPKGTNRNTVVFAMGKAGAHIGNCALAKNSLKILEDSGDKRAPEMKDIQRKMCP